MEKSNFTAMGVSYHGRIYWHSNLGKYRGKAVSIKAEPDSSVEIEVFMMVS